MSFKKYFNLYLILISACLFVFMNTSCNTASNKARDVISATSIQDNPPAFLHTASGVEFDSSQIAAFLKKYPLFKSFSKQFDTLYKNNNYNYLWFDDHGMRETTNKLFAHINQLDVDGVSQSIPYHDDFMQMLQEDSANSKESLNTILELMITGQYFNYVKKVFAGSVSDKLDSINWFIKAKKFSYVDLLETYLKSGEIGFQGQPLLVPQYAKLKKYLGDYRELEKKITSEILIPPLTKGQPLKPNDSAIIIPFLKKRLSQLGMYDASDTSKLYHAALIKAVNLSKSSYGLKSDSLITASLINALNVPLRKRIEQIIVNMERFRWIPRDTASSEFIFVNIPEYTLHYFQRNKEVWRCNVVVGKQMTKTVIFSGRMKYVVFSPYWNVPKSIIEKEVKPGMARNKNYLASHRMEWNGGNVRQIPGPDNSLGLVKFLFPNSNNIYLHDTPSKSLFNNDSRAYSHGCIRVSKPRDLAIRVLKQDPSWTEFKIDEAMNAGKETYVTLKYTIPVYIGYFTAFVNQEGVLQFRDDVYKRDEKLMSLLNQ